MKGLDGNMKFLFFYLLLLMGFLIFFQFGLLEGIAEEYEIPYPINQPQPSENWFENIWVGIANFIETMGFYWTVFTIAPDVAPLSWLFIISGVIIVLIFIKDYLTPIIDAIGNLIPFT